MRAPQVMFALFTVLTAGWGWLLHTHKAAAHKIHYLMLALVVFKALTCLSQALMYYYLEATGKADGWNVAYYIFTFFRWECVPVLWEVVQFDVHDSAGSSDSLIQNT